MVATILGGIGLFLLGMVLLTDGLRSAAGGALRTVLGRFTGGTVRAILSGAGVTALVQSSSATVLTTIGFVSAGLLTLRQAVGVIFGASVGTTSTGWIVALLGLKLSIGALALPLVGIGALMRLLTRDRMAATGLAIAGFGLIFVGIDVLQQGMTTLSERFDPASLPAVTFAGRLLLVAIGVATTVVMQSSSAAVAATLTALHTGTITLEQGAALVIGQSIGTTVTAALASIGASVPARRTALAHILFNATAGAVAFLLVPVALQLETTLAARLDVTEPALLIAAFHTSFNLLGLLLLAPFIDPFTRLITRMVPDAGPALTRNLDPSVAELPPVAVEAARRVVLETADVVLGVLADALRQPRRDRLTTATLDDASNALHQTRRFLATVRASEDAAEHARRLSLHHAMDHLDRLVERIRHHTPADPPHDPAFDQLRAGALAIMPGVRAWLRSESGAAAPNGEWQRFSEEVAERRRTDRDRTLARTAAGEMDPDLADRRLAAMRWLDSSAYHVWRTVHHLAVPDPLASATAPL
ncbi:MAG TPA: Na/Pi symporter [Longimicrobiales bacterium]|nr:Na/Pi symporter [Longimicrobiales bacterium]